MHENEKGYSKDCVKELLWEFEWRSPAKVTHPFTHVTYAYYFTYLLTYSCSMKINELKDIIIGLNLVKNINELVEKQEFVNIILNYVKEEL